MSEPINTYFLADGSRAELHNHSCTQMTKVVCRIDWYDADGHAPDLSPSSFFVSFAEARQVIQSVIRRSVDSATVELDEINTRIYGAEESFGEISREIEESKEAA